MPDSESFGEPHTLTVYFDGDELTYDLEHPQSCTKKVYAYEFACYGGESPTVEEWDCDVAWQEGESGLFESLSYSGTPVTEPGTYRIQGWSRKYYVPAYGAYEHDSGVGVMQEEAGDAA
jgi:hypothetical protein